MPGTNAGTGQPYNARCAKCKIFGHRHRNGYKLEVLARRTHQRRGGARMDRNYKYEYRCLDCGHIGWSRHLDMKWKWEAKEVVK